MNGRIHAPFGRHGLPWIFPGANASIVAGLLLEEVSGFVESSLQVYLLAL
jgi:hypothetical protein